MSDSSHNGSFKGKVVVITGSSRGIGKATAVLFCSLGARVVLNGRNSTVLDACLAEFKSLGYIAEKVCCDISTPDGSKTLVDNTIKYFGSLDILINNAGMSMRGKIDELDPRVFEKVFSINLFGAVYPVLYSLPYLKRSEGSVVFVSSVAGIRGLPSLSAYSSSKMALRAIAESMRFDLKEHNIHTGLIYVGYARNDAGKKYLDKDGTLKPIEERQGVKALSQEEIALAILKNISLRKFITILSGLGRLNATMQRISPRFVEWILMRNMKKIERMSK